MKDYKYHYAYMIMNKINSKMYMGIHSTNNLNDRYFGSGLYLHRSIKKNGKENFNKTIIKFFNSRKEASDFEKDHVTSEVANDNMFYNVKSGGDNECINSQNSINKTIKKLTGRTKENYPNLEKAGIKRSATIKGRTSETHSYVKERSLKRVGTNKFNHSGVKSQSGKLKGRNKYLHLGVLKSSIKHSKGFYITPYGTFYSTKDAAKMLGCSSSMINNCCRRKNSIIFTNRSFLQSSGIFTTYKRFIGKTYKEIGFYFARFTNEQQKIDLFNQLSQEY